ncbi:hypothetical protein J2751_001068 [Halorubrum alkaliphilum]|uniref:Uncharacterized protein n=1 Tax=Halorubrum alkaliphilum TaxID=261290 RepID=A0A8T4GD77_9EURY|nr:hypothetical protein [Halorubrum alkaliphilum]MBP1922063.1 hypothetical protein [Halorubrum alkaliphilum]
MERESRFNASRRRVLLGTATLGTLALAGCADDEGDEPDDDHDEDDHDDDDHDDDHADDDHDHDGTSSIAEFELLDSDGEDVLAWVHDDHWDGGLPTIEEGHSLTVEANVEDEEGHALDLGGDATYEIRAEVLDAAADGVVSLDNHGDHVDIHGEEEGVTELEFMLWHDDHADYTTPPITVQVAHDHEDGHEHGDDGDVDELEIVDRSTDEVVANAHDGHWDGSLPGVSVGDNLSLGANFYDHDGHEFHLGGDEEYEFRARLADGADELVTFEFHGDHLHVEGEEEGHTDVVFQLWHDDHADYESPAVHLDVVADDEEVGSGGY